MASLEKVKANVAKTKTTSIATLIQNSVDELGKALPSHMKPERIVRIALTTLKMNPALYQCDPMSFLGALFQSAQLGLEPNVEGQAYIIPYGKQATFQIGFKGYIELFYRHEIATGLQWGIICENDFFEFDKGKNYLSHTFDLKKERGEPYGYWVKAFMKEGASSFEVMSKTQCLAHGKKHSKTFKKGPWQTDTDAMCLKTVLIQLMKILPKSVELQRAIAMDETIKTKVDADMFKIPDETNWKNGAAEAVVKPGEPNGNDAKAMVEKEKAEWSDFLAKKQILGVMFDTLPKETKEKLRKDFDKEQAKKK